MASPGGSPAGPPPGQPGGPPPGMRQPTPQEIQQIQQQLAAEAAKRGMTVQQYVAQIRAQQMQAMQQRNAQQQQQGGGPPPPPQEGQPGSPPPPPQGQQQPVQPGPPKPEAIAVANFLKSQDLKQRTCLFQEKRRDLFKVKRAIRALQTPAYEKARSKNPLLPEVKDRETAENAFKLLPLSLLALRVSKVDPHEGHAHPPGKKSPKRVKGLWTVRIEQHQTAEDQHHYMWMYEGSQWRQKAYAAGALALVVAVVMFPLWPLKMRIGVWYLSMGMLGLLGLFFAMAIFRLILFCITVFATPPGLWLYPNLFEDVGFFDSFRPTWAWHESTEEKKVKAKAKKQAKKSKGNAKGAANGKAAKSAESEKTAPASTGTAKSTATETPAAQPTQRSLQASVEEADED